MTFKDALRYAKQQLTHANKEARVAELLLMHVTTWSNATLFSRLSDTMPEALYQTYLSFLVRHIDDDVPLQHLTEEEIFFGHSFYVNADVLIPRFETEELVARVLSLFDDYFDRPVRAVDLGTGSGAIAITLAKEEPRIQVDAVDISPAALQVAAKNAKTHQVSVTFYEGSWCDPLTQRYEMVVANPPYIPVEEELPKQIVAYEPHTALFGGADGLAHYREIFLQLPSVVADTFLVAMEHGHQHATAIQSIAKEAFPKAVVWSERDMQGKERFTFVSQGLNETKAMIG
jgi:release factor glutamine methyltransferase